MKPQAVLAAIIATLTTGVSAQEAKPLSAIDWLSQSVTSPVVVAPAIAAPSATPPKPSTRAEPPVADSAATLSVTTTPLDGPSPDPIGLLAPEATGLPRSLWAASEEATLIALLRAEQIDGLPAMQELLTTLLMAEADAPLGASPQGALFLARIDKLLDLGAVEPAQALLEQTQTDTTELFRRWFDAALLTGNEDRACDTLKTRIDVAPTYPARIFCLARTGDWAAATLSLNTHLVLGDITDEEEQLLTRFMDPESFEGEADLPPPTRISPLVFRIREAIGEPLQTDQLPRAFAHADLRSTVGWKSQLEAAERLSRQNAIVPSVLFDLYRSRTPSASGGVWDRAKAVQRFDIALRGGDADAVTTRLPAAWQAAKAAKVELAFARFYAPELAAVTLEGAAETARFEIGLLSPLYEAVALSATDQDPFLTALARGIPQTQTAPNALAQAITAGFDAGTPPAAVASLAEDGKLGEAILRSMAILNAGIAGDGPALTQAIAFLRSVGLEDVARRAGLQLLLLERFR